MKKITAFPFTSKMTFDEKGWPQLDRGVTSEVLRKVLKNYYVNGVFGINDSACLQVAASMDDSAIVKVKPGVCHIQGATGYTEDEASLELTASDTSLPRIDTVVVRLNDNMDYRAIYLDIIPGTPASTPQPPALTRSDSIWEIGLANLYRAANSTVISNSDITDTRQDSSRCGYVTAINKLDTESLMQQLNAYYDEFVSQCETDYDVSRQQYLLQCQNIIDDVISFKDATKEEILAWFQEMKDQLSEDAALHLQIQISKLKEDIEKVKTPDFNDSGEVEGINSFTDFMSSFVKKTSIYQLFANLKAGLQYVLHTGQLVNNGLCEESGKFALDAAYGHTIAEQITQLYSGIADGITVRYNEENDTIELLKDGEWVFWRNANTRRKYIIQDGIPLYTFNNTSYWEVKEGYFLFRGSGGTPIVQTVDSIDTTGFTTYTVIQVDYTSGSGMTTKMSLSNNYNGHDAAEKTFGITDTIVPFFMRSSYNKSYKIKDIYME